MFASTVGLSDSTHTSAYGTVNRTGHKRTTQVDADHITLVGAGGSHCSDNRYSDNRYSDNRAVGLGLISVFDHHGRKQLGLSTSSTKVFTLLLCQQSDLQYR